MVQDRRPALGRLWLPTVYSARADRMAGFDRLSGKALALLNHQLDEELTEVGGVG